VGLAQRLGALRRERRHAGQRLERDAGERVAVARGGGGAVAQLLRRGVGETVGVGTEEAAVEAECEVDDVAALERWVLDQQRRRPQHPVEDAGGVGAVEGGGSLAEQPHDSRGSETVAAREQVLEAAGGERLGHEVEPFRRLAAVDQLRKPAVTCLGERLSVLHEALRQYGAAARQQPDPDGSARATACLVHRSEPRSPHDRAQLVAGLRQCAVSGRAHPSL
jgi:hypothetical protein